MSTPRISVCVPTYNGQAYLDECLAGLAAQTFGDFEVLIVDDCSSDATVEMARTWAARDERFSVHVNERNLGLVGNWNHCIGLARGEWIKYLFQDDLIEPRCLEAMLAAGERSPGFVACSRRFVFEECDATTRAYYVGHKATLESLFAKTPVLSADDYSRAKLDNLDINIVGEPTVTMIRKSLFDRYGLFDPLMVQICDSEMWTRLASNVGMTFIEESLVAFRVHGASASSVNQKRPLRGTNVDGIVESIRFCESPLFAAFRASAERAGRLAMLSERLETQCNIAFYALRDAERQRPRNPAIKRDFVAVMNQLGSFRKARNRHWWFRFRRLLGLAPAVP